MHYRLLLIGQLSQKSLQDLLYCFDRFSYMKAALLDTTEVVKRLLKVTSKFDLQSKKPLLKFQKSIRELVFNDENKKIDPCETDEILQLSIIIKNFRNFMSHLTYQKCKHIDNREIKELEEKDQKMFKSFDCTSWSEIMKIFKFAVKQVLEYLKSKGVIDEERMERDLKFMKDVDNMEIADIMTYKTEIIEYVKLEQFWSSLKDIENKLDRISNQISLKVSFKISLILEQIFPFTVKKLPFETLSQISALTTFFYAKTNRNKKKNIK